VKTTK